MKNETIQCRKCSGNRHLLMEDESGVKTYYCPSCYMLIYVNMNDSEIDYADPSVAIETVMYRVAAKVPTTAFEEKNISQDIFLKLLLDKKESECLL